MGCYRCWLWKVALIPISGQRFRIAVAGAGVLSPVRSFDSVLFLRSLCDISVGAGRVRVRACYHTRISVFMCELCGRMERAIAGDAEWITYVGTARDVRAH
jgi:hypothetical protein